MGVTAAMMTIVALAGTGIYVGLKTLENYNPGRKKIQRDLQSLKEGLRPYIEQLVPWSEEEMARLSLNLINKKTSKGIAPTVRGVFTTIYHEPLIAWVCRRYVAAKENNLVYARTSNHEFIYRTKKNKTDVVVDDQLLGHIDSQGVLYPVRGREAIAYINKTTDGIGWPIVVRGKERGRMNNPAKAEGVSPRAFQLTGKMEEESQRIFLAMALIEMIKAKTT